MLVFAFSILSSSFSQTPQSFNYQAVVRNDDGTPLRNQVIDIRISILEGSDQGNAVFVETHDNISTDTFGLVSLEVGSIADLSSVNWSANTHFIQIEIDVNGNANYKNLGAFQILAVPYAIYGRDEDSDPSNESIATMELNGNTLEVIEESGNTKTVDLSGLSVGNTLWTENSPGNISYDGQVVGVNATSGDKLVELGDGGSGDGHVNVFNQNNIVAELGTNSSGSGSVFLYPPNSQIGDATNVDISSYSGQFADDGYIDIFESSRPVVNLGSNGDNAGFLELYSGDPANIEPIIILANEENTEAGLISVLKDNVIAAEVATNGVGAGFFRTFGPVSNELIKVTSGNNGTTGVLEVFGASGDRIIELNGVNNGNNGFFRTFGPNGTDLVRINSTAGTDNGTVSTYSPDGDILVNITTVTDNNNNTHGAVSIYDEGGTARGGLSFNNSNQSRVWADVKNFVMQHPQKSNKQIWYACIEGPEAAAYERGTAQLINGEAFIPFSETFGLVANPTTMTVNLTPLSAESMGMAVIEKRSDGFRVKELMKGKGNYEFDWEVKAVRKGFENFEVIRDKQEVDYGKSTSVNANRDNLNSTPKRSSTSKKPKQKN